MQRLQFPKSEAPSDVRARACTTSEAASVVSDFVKILHRRGMSGIIDL